MKTYTYMGMTIEPYIGGWCIFDEHGVFVKTATGIKNAREKIKAYRKQQGSDYKPLEIKPKKILDPTVLGSV
jgi:hypothetical protein